MTRFNPYAFAFVLGSSVAIALSAFARAFPDYAAGMLPLGGDDFVQSAIIILPLLAVAAIWDIWNTRR